jgi:hypothetical protein
MSRKIRRWALFLVVVVALFYWLFRFVGTSRTHITGPEEIKPFDLLSKGGECVCVCVCARVVFVGGRGEL